MISLEYITTQFDIRHTDYPSNPTMLEGLIKEKYIGKNYDRTFILDLELISSGPKFLSDTSLASCSINIRAKRFRVPETYVLPICRLREIKIINGQNTSPIYEFEITDKTLGQTWTEAKDYRQKILIFIPSDDLEYKQKAIIDTMSVGDYLNIQVVKTEYDDWDNNIIITGRPMLAINPINISWPNGGIPEISPITKNPWPKLFIHPGKSQDPTIGQSVSFSLFGTSSPIEGPTYNFISDQLLVRYCQQLFEMWFNIYQSIDKLAPSLTEKQKLILAIN